MKILNYVLFSAQVLIVGLALIGFMFMAIGLITNEGYFGVFVFSSTLFVLTSVLYAPWKMAKGIKVDKSYAYYSTYFGTVMGMLLSFCFIVAFLKSSNITLLIFMFVFIGHLLNLKTLLGLGKIV